MTFNKMNVSLCHISVKDSNISDFVSRNLIECTNENWPVCKFLSVNQKQLKSLNTKGIISRNFKLPFTNYVSCKNSLKEDNDLCRVYSHL